MQLTNGASAGAVFEAMAADERYLGYGFLQFGDSDFGSGRTALIERAVLKAAVAEGMDYETLFEWANSKCGRWFGEDNGQYLKGRKSADVQAEATASFAYMRKLQVDGLW